MKPGMIPAMTEFVMMPGNSRSPDPHCDDDRITLMQRRASSNGSVFGQIHGWPYRQSDEWLDSLASYSYLLLSASDE